MMVDTTIDANAIDEKIVDRIVKLLSLSKSSNVNEAALAAQKAHELLLKYNLDVDTIRSAQGKGKAQFQSQRYTVWGLSDKWRSTLLNVVTKNNFCKAVVVEAQEAAIIGQPHNIKVSQYLFEYLLKEIIRLGGEEWKKQTNQNAAKRSWLNSFYHGAIKTIATRLAEQRNAEMAANNKVNALIVQNDAALVDAVKELIGATRRPQQSRVSDQEAFESGQEAAKKIALNKVLEEKNG